MKKLFFLAAVLAVAAGCRKEPIQVESVFYKGGFQVEFLFEHDGCKVYRFYDARTVYYTDCTGKIDYEYQVSNGKYTTTHYQETYNNQN